MPTRAWEYSSASLVSKPRDLNSRPRIASVWWATSLRTLEKFPDPDITGESRTSTRNPSVSSSM